MKNRLLYCFIAIWIISIAIGTAGEMVGKDIHTLEIAEVTDNHGMLEVLISSSNADVITRVLKEINLAKRSEFSRVTLEPGPIIVLKNKQGEPLTAFMIRLDGALSFHRIEKKGVKLFIAERIDFRNMDYLTVDPDGFLKGILALWYSLHRDP